MIYRKGIVYFIDILGSQERTSSKSSFDESYFIADTFLTEMQAVQQRHRNTSLVDRAVFAFSDCAYIVYSLKENVEQSDENILDYIYQSLYNTQMTICNFVYNGFLCRGGIAYDDVYFDLSKNMIFGPAVNKAYQLESKVAVYPNIVLDDNLAKVIEDYSELIKGINPHAILNGDIIKQNTITSKYYLNYLSYFYRIGTVQLGKQFVTFSEFYEKALSYVQTEISKHSGQSDLDQKIRTKLEWHLNYLEETKVDIENDEFSEIDLLNLIFG